MRQQPLPELIDGLPNLCGADDLVDRAMASTDLVFYPQGTIDFAAVKSAFAIALHMHQPLIPAGGPDLRTADVISNLQFMMEHPEMPDAHNAPVFKRCYERMGEFVPQLLAEGARPRVMLDYSGCLLYGLRHMGAGDVIERLRPLAQDPALRNCVEWLGTTWGHAVAPSTPVQDFRLHVRAWQHHFAATFGLDALARVRGFSPPEMALPNHPDVAYAFVRTLLDCGYRWVLLQADSVERVEDGGPVRQPHLPHRLVARNSAGRTANIVALIKTQGSDNKLVAQMQPYHEARTLPRARLGDVEAPQLVSQIGDGENGNVIMNEFPPMFLRTMREAMVSRTIPMTGTEYLEHLAAAGVDEATFPLVQPVFQHRIWERFDAGGGDGGEDADERHRALGALIQKLQAEDKRFHMEGGSWTNHISWVRDYDHVLRPMEGASARFAEATRDWRDTRDPRYRRALFHLLTSQTSCFRYWGRGTWTDYGVELCRRTEEVLDRMRDKGVRDKGDIRA